MDFTNNTSEFLTLSVKSRYPLCGRFAVIINEIAVLFPDTQIHLKKQALTIDAKSTLSILALSAQIGDNISVEAKGPQAMPAAVSLVKALSGLSGQTPEQILSGLQARFGSLKPSLKTLPTAGPIAYKQRLSPKNKGYIHHIFSPSLLKSPLKMLYNLIADKGKPSEKRGRKATGLK